MVSSSSMTPPVVKDGEPRNWSELPPELTSSILARLGPDEILENAQKVCRAWRRASKDPSLWRKIDMRRSCKAVDLCDMYKMFRSSEGSVVIENIGNDSILTYIPSDRDYFGTICRNAVDRSEGGLVEINIGDFCTDSLLAYIADRSSNLRSLGLTMDHPMTNNGLVKAVAKLPLLEVLEVSCIWEKLDLKAIGHSCPKLKTLMLNCSDFRSPWYSRDDDDDALAIAESMPELHHLQLLGNRLTDTGLKAILDNCPHMEHLDLRNCFYINLSGDLEKRCLERVKEFRRPNDLTVDCPFDVAFFDTDSDDDSDDIDVADDFAEALLVHRYRH